MELKNTYLQKSYDAVQSYYTLKTENDNLREIARQSYIGERLTRELQKLDSAVSIAKSDMESTLRHNHEAAIGDLLKRREAALAQGESDALDGEKITLDYRLLELPVPLSHAQMETLARRHWNNSPFIETLKRYEAAHKGDHQTPQPDVIYSDPYADAVKAALAAFQWIESKSGNAGGAQVLRDNPHQLERLDAAMVEALESICEETASVT